jgi:hypothetical protein
MVHACAPDIRTHGLRARTLLVGLMHGMAGSAALRVSQASRVAVGLGYVAPFGIGSTIGFGALSAMMAMPLVFSTRWLAWANGFRGAIGANTIIETVFAYRATRRFPEVNIFISRSPVIERAGMLRR